VYLESELLNLYKYLETMKICHRTPPAVQPYFRMSNEGS